MSLRILVAPDKFKGTLTADEAAEAIVRGWKKARPEDAFDLAPISDGGDGFGPILSKALEAKAVRTKTVDAAHREVTATWWWNATSKTAVIESANIIGLAMLPRGKFHPFDLDTEGLGRVMRAVARKGARRCFVGIGGSATNDGGFGMARVLGWQFLNADDREITRWTELHSLRKIVSPKPRRLVPSVTVAVDVQNKLLGRLGCSRVYGPQKGLEPDDMKPAERALKGLAKGVDAFSRKELAEAEGAGAAGGLGFGLTAFAGAKMRPGFELIAQTLKLRQRLRRADLVLTGEGSLDASTAMGKGVGELALLARECGVACGGLAGHVSPTKSLSRLFQFHDRITGITGSKSAMKRPAHWLAEVSRRAAARF